MTDETHKKQNNRRLCAIKFPTSSDAAACSVAAQSKFRVDEADHRSRRDNQALWSPARRLHRSTRPAVPPHSDDGRRQPWYRRSLNGHALWPIKPADAARPLHVQCGLEVESRLPVQIAFANPAVRDHTRTYAAIRRINCPRGWILAGLGSSTPTMHPTGSGTRVATTQIWHFYWLSARRSVALSLRRLRLHSTDLDTGPELTAQLTLQLIDALNRTSYSTFQFSSAIRFHNELEIRTRRKQDQYLKTKTKTVDANS